MTKTEELASLLKEKLVDFKVTEVNSKKREISLDSTVEDATGKWMLKINTKTKYSIFYDDHFVARANGDVDTLVDAINKEYDEQANKEIMKSTNDELCGYLTMQFDDADIVVTGKSTNTEFATYYVTYKDQRYKLVATINSDKAVLYFIPGHGSVVEMAQFELSNPTIDKIVKDRILSYDKEG